jgi:flagellar biosynthesis/type III secretory pathway protein FliH
MASIIKSSDERRTCAAAPFHFDELRGQVAAGQPGSSPLVANAMRDAERMRRQAQDDARAAANAAAQQILDEKVERRLAALVPALQEAVTRIDAAKSQCLAHWERAAVRVAAAIAERVIRRQLDRQPEIALAIVREALELACGAGDVQLRMHPEDCETLGRHVETLSRELARMGKVDIVSDPTISKGGCRVETRYGVIDQQIESQLARIEQELT